MKRSTQQLSNDDNHKEKSQSSQAIVQDMDIQKIKDNIKIIQRNTICRMNEDPSILVTKTFEKIENTALRNDFNGFINPISEKDENTRKRNNEFLLPEKQFIPRNSLLTDMFEEKHIRSIYHMFIAILIIAFMNSGVTDALNGNEIRLGLRYISIGFGKFQQVLLIWMSMFIATLLVYPMFRLWAAGRTFNIQKKQLCRAWDVAWLTGFILYLVAFVYYSLKWRDHEIPLASSTIVICEQSRMLMKMHAFVRSNAPAVIYDTTKPLPGFSRFLYFLFAPTFVYRNVYPRTNVIQWGFVTARLLEVLGALFMMSFIMEHYIEPEFGEFGIKSQTWGSIIGSLFRTILPASVVTLCVFFLLLHSWMNAWAEALLFADRLFYQDWWNAQSFSAFYRAWNGVVYDYLFTYIYRDVHQLLGYCAYRRVLATLAVFTVSALMHEFMIGIILGYCYPVLFVQFFGFGLAFMFVRSRSGNGLVARCGNVFIWWALSSGFGMLGTLHAMEKAARLNCPVSDTPFLDWKQYFVPRSWTCNGLH